MEKEYVIGIDLGTSGIKTVLYDRGLNSCGSVSAEYPMLQPYNGWAEEDPDEWYNAAVKCIRKLLSDTGADTGAIKAVSFSGQMNGLVMTDAEGKPCRPSILWCDQRCSTEAAELARLVGAEKLFRITGNPAQTGFTAAKLLWVMRNEPECYAACRHVMLAKDYLLYKLTGEYVSDISDASGTQLMDINTCQWSEEVCEAMGLPISYLGRLIYSPEYAGSVSAEASADTGLPTSVKVSAGAGDNMASAIGTGAITDCGGFITLGTSGVINIHSDILRVEKEGRLHSFRSGVPGCCVVLGSVQSAGLSMQWMRNLLYADDKDYVQINRDIAGLPIGADRLIYLPYLLGDRSPHMDPDARGVFVGLSSHHNRTHIARAVMEGISCGIADCFDLMKDMGISPKELKLCGGGAKSPLWSQMLADMLNITVKVPSSGGGAALGAGILASVCAGFYRDVRSACAVIPEECSVYEPDAGRHLEYAKLRRVFDALYPSLKDSFKELARL